MIPQQPGAGTKKSRRGAGVPLQGRQVVERIDIIKRTGVDQAHAHIVHRGPIGILMEARILAMKNGLWDVPKVPTVPLYKLRHLPYILSY